MLRISFLVGILLIVLIDYSSAQGAAWTKEETEIIATKILWKESVKGPGMNELVVANVMLKTPALYKIVICNNVYSFLGSDSMIA